MVKAVFAGNVVVSFVSYARFAPVMWLVGQTPVPSVVHVGEAFDALYFTSMMAAAGPLMKMSSMLVVEVTQSSHTHARL